MKLSISTWILGALVAAASQATPVPAMSQEPTDARSSGTSLAAAEIAQEGAMDRAGSDTTPLAPVSPPANEQAGARGATAPAGTGSRASDGNAAPADPDALVKPAPWLGTLAEGYDEIRALAARQQYTAARHLADALLAPSDFLVLKAEFRSRGGWRRVAVDRVDPLLDGFGWNGPSVDERAEVLYARGVVGLLAKDRKLAEDDLQSARGLSRSRSLQDDALYDVAWLALDAGEEARAQLPEISGAPPAPPPPPAAAGAPASPQPPDPLKIARQAYLEAREHFVERLKSDWRDADTQANVELCLRRLRELDEIEKQREEEKKKQEQQKKDQQEKQDQDKKDDSKKDPQKPEDSKKGDESDPKDPKDPKPDEEKPEPPEKPEDEQPKTGEDKPKDEPKKAPPKDSEPTEMSHEEMTQLFDRLQKLEEESRRIQAALKAARRGKVKKDW